MPPNHGIILTAASVTIAGKVILPPVSLTLTGQRIGIVVRNGSGKTTLLRVTAGLIGPSAGEVRRVRSGTPSANTAEWGARLLRTNSGVVVRSRCTPPGG